MNLSFDSVINLQSDTEVKPLIPKFIEESFNNEQRQGSFSALALFIDLTDFTPLTEAMMNRGKDGAERLSLFLNSMFGPLVKMVYEHGGFVPYFAGDAFTGVFPEEKDLEAQVTRILALSKKVKDYVESLPPVDTFKVGVKQGVSLGTIEWGIVGSDNIHSFYFRGSAITSSSDAQCMAKEQEVIVDHSIKHLLPDSVRYIRIADTSFHKLIEFPSFDKKVTQIEQPEISEVVARKFLPNSVIGSEHAGEFRYVLSMFLSFEGASNHEELDVFVSEVLRAFSSYGGYFKEVDFGDKGGVLVGFFGAPVSYEDNDFRAMELVCVVKEFLENNNSKIRIRGGLTKGTAFTGNIGGDERAQYAVVGNQVNLAARLMMKAGWGEIWVDGELAKNKRFTFEKKGDFRYKGVADPMPTFELVSRCDTYLENSFTGPMIGREKELAELADFSFQNLMSRKGNLTMLYGEAGIGKSIFLQKLRNKVCEKIDLEWFRLQPDPVLSRPFHGFVQMLRKLLEQSAAQSKAENRQKFDSIYNEFLLLFQEEEYGSILNELERTRPILAALVGISYENSVWEQLDAKGRFENSIAAISNLIIAQSNQKPVVIEIEDAHSLDENSIALLKSLVKRIGKLPISIILAARVNDDGSKPEHLQEGLSGVLAEKEFQFAPFKEARTKQMAEELLGGKISETFSKLLCRITNGNPFYIEQIVQYFSETNILSKVKNEWSIKDQKVGVSDSIQSILTARLDRLSRLVKETVKTAAVIGREFEVDVLSKVMSTEDPTGAVGVEAIFQQIKSAEQVQIWQAMNELRYIFKHSMLREAVYDMQMNSRLRKLHARVAAAIEQLHENEIEDYFGDLAFHYQQGRVYDKAKFYLKKAALKARDNFQNKRALELYDRLIALHKKEKEVVPEIKCLLKKAGIYELIGQWPQCEKALKWAIRKSKKLEDLGLLARSQNELGRLYVLQGDYKKAMPLLEQAISDFKTVKDQHGVAKGEGNLGILYFRKGEYEKAKVYLRQSMDLSHELHISADAQIASSLGLAHMNQGNFEEGISEMQKALNQAKRHNDKRSMANLYTYIGVLQMEKDDHAAALKSLEEGLKMSESLGNKLFMCICTGCLGGIYQVKGDFDAAMKNFEIDLAMSLELGDKQGIAIAHGLVGELQVILGKFGKAKKSLKKSLKLSQEIGYKKGSAKAENNLGDIYYLQKKYKKAQKKYISAVEISRAIDNKIVMGESLLELAATYLELGKLDKAHATFSEATIIGQSLGNHDFIFDSKILGARLENAKGHTENSVIVLQGLLETKLSLSKTAEVYFYLHQFDSTNNTYLEKARNLYEKLVEQIPRYINKHRLEILRR